MNLRMLLAPLFLLTATALAADLPHIPGRSIAQKKELLFSDEVVVWFGSEKGDVAAMPDLLFDGPSDAITTIALAHGSGSGLDTSFMNAFAKGFADHGYRVARFEFPYMASYRTTGKRKPPDREPVLRET